MTVKMYALPSTGCSSSLISAFSSVDFLSEFMNFETNTAR